MTPYEGFNDHITPTQMKNNKKFFVLERREVYHFCPKRHAKATYAERTNVHAVTDASLYEIIDGAYLNLPYSSSSHPLNRQYWLIKDGLPLLTEAEVEEGYRHDKTVKFLRRNANIIRSCKERDGNRCCACAFKLDVNGISIIDCHHLFPFKGTDGSRVTLLNDLICLCPTCHRVAHTTQPPLDIDGIRTARNLRIEPALANAARRDPLPQPGDART